MVSRYDIIRRAELYRDDIAVAVIPQDGVDRVAAAVRRTSCWDSRASRRPSWCTAAGENVLMSARSLGEVNVR